MRIGIAIYGCGATDCHRMWWKIYAIPARIGRPGRKRLVREYICEQAGKHFDPKVMEVFIQVVIGN